MVALLFAGASFGRHDFGARPASRPPGCDGPTTGSRFPGLPGWRSSSRSPAASAAHAPHDVEPTPRVRTPLERRLSRSRAGGAFTETRRPLTSRCPRRAPAHRLRIDGPLPLRAPLDARRSSPSDQGRRLVAPVRRTRAHDPGRLRRIDTCMLATRVEPKPPSPPAAAFEGDDACARRPSNGRGSRMTERPAAPHRSLSLSLRGPRHLRMPRVPASQVTRPASRLATPGVRATAMRSTDFCHPNQTTASTHASCAPSFFSEACASCSLEGLGPSKSPTSSRSRESIERLGATRCSKAGEPAFHDAGFASADRAFEHAGRCRHPRARLGRASDTSVAPLGSVPREPREHEDESRQDRFCRGHREVRAAFTIRSAFPR